MDLVEPNSQGVKEMGILFDKYSIPKEKYSIHSCLLEDFPLDKQFDIIIAEGFLDAMHNQEEIVSRLKKLVKKQGVVVITCADDACMFIEIIKRLIGVILTKDIHDYHKKKNFLVHFFEPQLKNLRGMSRPVGDWVEDQMLCESMINGCELSMEQAITLLGEGFYVLGASPRMFTDYSWYKDVWFDTENDYKRQFREKRLSLLMAGLPETCLTERQAERLVNDFARVRHLVAAYERQPQQSLLSELQLLLDKIAVHIDGFDDMFVCVFKEIRRAICDVMKGDIVMERYPHFFAAFGKTQQYIAFEKK